MAAHEAEQALKVQLEELQALPDKVDSLRKQVSPTNYKAQDLRSVFEDCFPVRWKVYQRSCEALKLSGMV